MDDDQKPRLPAIDRFPGPALAYSTDSGDAVLRSVNDEFTAAFGPADEGEEVADLLRRHDDSDSDGSPTRAGSYLAEFSTPRQFTIHTPASDGHPSVTYRGTVVPPTGDKVGLVLFVDSTSADGLDVDGVASVISHDLRNPLDVAKTRLRAGRSEGEEEHFDHVALALERMEQIIEDVLTLARGERVVDPDDRADLTAMVRAAWETVDTADATLAIDDPLPTVIADRDRVGRLFENLFRNAVEHGGRTVSVRVGSLPDDAGLYVEDDGPGISPEHRETVFRPGQSSNPHGTGLGLAIVARIVAVHGWTVTLNDGPDGGARFELRDVEPVS